MGMLRVSRTEVASDTSLLPDAGTVGCRAATKECRRAMSIMRCRVLRIALAVLFPFPVVCGQNLAGVPARSSVTLPPALSR